MSTTGKISEKRRNDLKAIQKQLVKLNQSIQDILDGKSSMSEFANGLGITPQELNNHTNKGVYSLTNKIKVLTKEDIEFLLRESETASERLMRAILGVDEDELFVLNIVEEEKLFEIMKQALCEREVVIIEYRFGFKGYPMTLEEIGKIFNVTKNRIMQIIKRALRKLRDPKWLKQLLPDYDLKIKELSELRSMMLVKNNLNTQIESAKNQIEKIDPVYNLPINELNLSVRAHNCLYRGCRITTIGELSKLSKFELLKLRNFGINTVKEISEALEKFGIV